MVELRNQMRECAELVDGPVQGDVVADLLIAVAPDQGNKPANAFTGDDLDADVA